MLIGRHEGCVCLGLFGVAAAALISDAAANRATPAQPGTARPISTTPPTSPPTTRATTEPATRQADRDERAIELPFVTVDRRARQVRVACEALALADAPLEFFCVANGGPEHESVLRSRARPSHVHAALLMLGMEPGAPVRLDPQTNRWREPHGPALRVRVEWTNAAGQRVARGAHELVRSIRDGRTMPRGDWIFTGSHVRAADGAYLADPTGYIVSLCNFEFTPIDVPRLVSSANETLEWQTDLTASPPRGTPVTMILEPGDPPATQATPVTQAATRPASR